MRRNRELLAIIDNERRAEALTAEADLLVGHLNHLVGDLAARLKEIIDG